MHNAKKMHNLLFDKFLKAYQINMKGKHQVQKYGEDYSGSDVNKSFLPAILFTSGRMDAPLLAFHFSSLSRVMEQSPEMAVWYVK